MSLWYVGYGSNLLAQGVQHYLAGGQGDRTRALVAPDATGEAGQWVEFPHPLYFAGRSKTWGGGVAFVDTLRRPGQSTHGRATRLTFEELHTIIARENGLTIELEASDLDRLRPGQSRLLQLEVDPEGFRGKYNAVLRLEDILGERAYTLTTSRVLAPAAPAEGYLERIRAGLLQRVDAQTADAYLRAALAYAPQA
jgi:hypothetical protein